MNSDYPERLRDYRVVWLLTNQVMHLKHITVLEFAHHTYQVGRHRYSIGLRMGPTQDTSTILLTEEFNWSIPGLGAETNSYEFQVSQLLNWLPQSVDDERTDH